MNNLLRHIREHSSEGLHCAIIIGAGNGSQLSAWRQLGCGHLLLVEAHPRQAEELGRRLHHEQGERLLALAVTADEQPMATLQSLNNLAYSSLNAAIGLFEHYPNLRSGEALQVPARSLGQLLTEQALDEQHPNLLLFAAPGQAMQLLQGTPASVLQAFTWLLIECSSEPLYQSDVSASDISFWLQGLGYELIADDPDALYPQSQLLFKRNASAVERLRLSAEVAELRSQHAHAVQTSQEQIAVLQQQVQQCDAALAEQTRLTNERQNQIDIFTKENAELTAARDALGKDKIALGAARNEQIKLANERQAQIAALSKDKSDLAARGNTLVNEKTELIKSRDEQTKLASERQTQIDVLGKEKADLVAARDAWTKEKAELTKSRDEQTKLASECRTQIDVLGKEKAALVVSHDAWTKEKAELTKTCGEQTKLASERKAQLDKITTERDQLQKSVAEQKKTFDNAQQQIKTLENEASDSLQRQQLLNEELLKAEAQIELIKDLLLREPEL